MRDPKPVVYVSGPITVGDLEANVMRAIRAAEELREIGAIPIVPHLSVAWQQRSPHRYRYWLDLDLDLIASGAVDAVYRLDGESGGAEEECRLAARLDIPVIEDLDDAELWITTWSCA